MARPTQLIKRLIALAMSVCVRGFDLLHVWLRRWLRQPVPCTGVVLYYHAIKPRQRARFGRQMDELLKGASPFRAESPHGMAEGRPNVAVTFDDGFESVVENAVPELSRRNIPFTMFVPSGCLGRRPSWVSESTHPAWEERVLSAAGLRSLARLPLATIGSHSITHPNLPQLDPERAGEELARSREALQTVAGTPIDVFSFPHGAYDTRLLEQAREAGYRRVFTIEPTVVTSDRAMFTVGRVAADPDDWPIEFRLKIAGAYRWRHYVQRLRRAG